MSSAGTSQVADWSRRSAWDSLSTTSRTEACAEAAITDAAPTSAMPTISAPAVLAVRFGCRVTLPFARPPSGRMPRTAGAASTPRTAPAIVGASVSTEITIVPAPTPSRLGRLSSMTPVAAAATAARPPTSRTAPAAVRHRDARSWATTSSRMASTGAVNAAFRAGTTAATRLTRVPVSTEIAIVKPSSGIRPESSMPIPAKICWRPATSPTSAPTPSRDPTTPITPASPSQVFASGLGQAGVIGVVGSLLGVGADVGLVAGLQQIFAGMGMELSGRIPLDGFTIAISVLTGTLVSLVAAVVPARKAALTAPVEAIRDDVVAHDRASRWRTAAGAVLLVGGLAAVAAAATGVVEDNRPSLLGVGAGTIVISVLMLAPTIAGAVLGVLAAPAVHGIRPLGGLAKGNVTRHPKRTASIAGALMIGMALVGAASVIAASAQASVRDVVDNESRADLLLQSATRDVPAELVAEVAALDGLRRVDPLRVAYSTAVGGEVTPVVGAPVGFFDATLTVPVVDGATAAMADGQAVVQELAAEPKGWQVGDTLTVAGSVGTVDVTIGAVIDSRAIGASVILPDQVYDTVADPTSTMTDTVFLLAEPGADIAQIRDQVTELAAPYVVVSVMDGDEFGDAIAEQVNQMLVILYALLGLSIVIAVLGIVNTLALSISERTREIGLLRAVGLGRLQLAGVVTIESVLTAVFGTVLGIGLGAGLAATMPTVFRDEGFTSLVIPWGPLGGLLGLAVVVGALAAVWPAARAARMDVLEAIAYE